MAKMGVIINSWSAGIPGDLPFLNWYERLGGPGLGVLCTLKDAMMLL